MNKEFYEGEPVTCVFYGKGVIKEIDHGLMKVVFKSESGKVLRKAYYNTDGTYYSKHNIVLYHGHVDFDIKTKPIRKFKQGQIVWWNMTDDTLWPVEFKEYESDTTAIVIGHYIQNHEQIDTCLISDLYESPKNFNYDNNNLL